MSNPFDPGEEFTSRYRVEGTLEVRSAIPALLVQEVASGAQRVARFVMGDAAAAVNEAAAPFEGLDHPNLARLLARGASAGHTFLVYEKIDGAGVPRLLEKHGRLAPAAALRIVRALAEALSMLHGRGLHHGGVRATNVVLTKKGTPRLADLGLHTGSPGASPAADLVAVGNLAFEAMAGFPSPPGGPARLGPVLQGVPPGLDDLMGRLAAGQVASADALLEALPPLLADPQAGGRKTPYEPATGGGTPPPADAPPATPPAAPAAGPDQPSAPASGGVLDLASSSVPSPYEYEDSSDEGPPSSVAGGIEDDFHQRKARAVVEATTMARKKKAAPVKLEVRVGERAGPGRGTLFLVILGGAALVGGVAKMAFDRPEFEGGQEYVKTGGRRDESSTTRTRRDLTTLVDNKAETGQELGRQIVNEPNLAKRAELVKDLLDRFPEEAPTVLTTVLRGGNDRLRKELFPFLVPLDPRGIFRLELMRFASSSDDGWPVRLAASLGGDGFTSELAEIGERPGWGAAVALAGSTRGAAEVPAAAAHRFEAAFFRKGEVRQKDLLKGWIRASGEEEGPVGVWVADTLLRRAKDDAERMIILESLHGMDPAAKVFAALAETVGGVGFAWDTEVVEYALVVLGDHAGEDAGRQRKLVDVRRRLQG